MKTFVPHSSAPPRTHTAIRQAAGAAAAARFAVLCLGLFCAGFLIPGLAMASQAAAQTGDNGQVAAMLPAHITLPVVLAHTIDSRHASVGQSITGKLAQRVQIGPKTWLPKGAMVHGRILAVNTAQATSGPSVTFEFHSVTAKDSAWRTKTSLLALASLMEVYNANEPATDFDDRANQNEHAWTVRQIGGDIVYRDSGRIDNRHGEKVGTEDDQGQYSLAGVNADGSTRLPRALGLFSTTAHGVYGMPGYSIGNSEKSGSITVSAGAENKNLRLHYGVALLLETAP